MLLLILSTVFLQLITLANAYQTALPVWLTSPLFRAGNNAVISNFTGSATNPQYTFTFSTALSDIPNLAYGIKGYRGKEIFK